MSDEPKNEIKSEEPDELAELRGKLEMCGKERDEYLAGWRRAKADLLNYKNEEMQRLEEVVKYGNADIIKETLDALQSFDLAIKNGSPKENEGFSRIRSQLEKVLWKRGVQRIEVKIGSPYDPQFHEVLSQEERAGDPPGIISEELSAGYTIHGKVIKTSKVKVTK